MNSVLLLRDEHTKRIQSAVVNMRNIPEENDNSLHISKLNLPLAKQNEHRYQQDRYTPDISASTETVLLQMKPAVFR